MFHVKHLEKIPLLVITGPTASGKTERAVKVAQALGGEIISADSRQVYQGMDLGTGKDLAEYQDIPHHLINLIDPTQRFSVSQFQELSTKAIQEVHQRGKLPILCGGTGHYIKALLQDYTLGAPTNPYFSRFLESLPFEPLKALHQALELPGPVDSKRRVARMIEKAYTNLPKKPEQQVAFDPLIFAIQGDRGALREKIARRLETRLKAGLVQEVRLLLDSGVSPVRLKSFGLEYRSVTEHLEGQFDVETLKTRLTHKINQFAKRQETFLRYMKKSGLPIQPCPDTTELIAQVGRWFGPTAPR